MKNCGGKILVAIAVLVVQVLMPSLVQAGGIGISPAVLDMNDALRGTVYQRTIILTNAEASQVKFDFAAEGEAGAWCTLLPYDGPDTPVTTVTVPPSSDLRLRLKISLPTDAPNGLHTGQIFFNSVITGPEGANGSAMAVSVGIAMDLKINVTGTQKLAGSVGDVSVLDVEVDQPPLRLVTRFQNTGNVTATPTLLLQVKDAQGKTVGEATFNAVSIDPGGIEQIKSEWDHSGKPAGKYTAFVTVTVGNEKLTEREIPFQILAKGALTRVGKLDELKLASEPQVGGSVKLIGMFQNTGKVDTKAILIAEIYRGANLLKVVESRERVIPAGQYGEIELFFDIPQADDYTVKAKVDYEGKLTVSKELTFKIAGGPSQSGVKSPTGTSTEGLSTALIVWLVAGVVTLLVCLIVGWILWRKRAEEQARRITRFGS